MGDYFLSNSDKQQNNMFGKSNNSSGGIFGGSGESGGNSLLPTFQDESVCAQCCPQLTYTQRIIGFCGCAGLGYVLSLVGTLTLIGGFSPQNVDTFIILYVSGNVIALCATGFLLGPKTQCKKMWDPSRRFTTAFYLSMLIVVFAVAITKQNIILILFLLFIEVLAGCWYGLSYIPFGRKIVSQFFRSTGVCFPCYFVYDLYQEKTQKPSVMSSLGGGGK